MATAFRIRDLRIVIYSNDHWPPHCHVIGRGCEAKVALGEGTAKPSLVTNNGLSRRQVDTALTLIIERRETLLEKWRELHGGN